MAKPNSGRVKKTSTDSIKPPRVGIFGARGRMGQEILQLWQQGFNEPAYLAVGDGNKALAKNWVKDLKDSKCKNVEIWIDFSSPSGFDKILSHCLENQAPLVSGTTGLEKNQFADLKKAAKKIPVLWAPNMSLGINILIKCLQSFSGSRGFDFQIEEVHHKHKKDKPSGTALWIHKELQKAVGKKLDEPLALRGGGVFGIHKIWALSEEETITLEHQALNRRVFAKGAIEAALWLYKKNAGQYHMSNLLGE